MEDSRLRKVYDTIVKEGYDVPDFATFETDMRDDKKLTRVRDRLVEDGYELPDFEQFKVDMFGTPASAPANSTFTAEQPRGMTKAEPEINDSAWDAYKNVGKIQKPTEPGEKETLTTFGEGFEQGADAIYQGSKYAVGEAARYATGKSQMIYDDALAYLDERGDKIDGKNFDWEKAKEDDRYARYEEKMELWRKEKAKRKAEREELGFFEGLKHKWNDPSMPDYKDFKETMGEDIRHGQALYAVKEALEEAGGDKKIARQILEKKASEEQWGDKKMREASEAMAKHKPVEGAAWWGQMVPQVAGQATAIASNLIPGVGGVLGKTLSIGTTVGLTMSSAGQAMAEARAAGASEDEIWATGLMQALIEYGSEKIPLDRLIGKMGSAAFKKGYKAIAGNIPEKELEKLLVEGNKRLGGKLLSGKTAKELIKDMGVEGASEFVAEFLGTYVPVIYADKESYPTLLEAVKNGWEGAKGGFAMGGFLGGGSMVLTNRANNKRRKMQGGVTLAETKDYGVVEVLRTKDDMTEVLLPDGNTEWVPLNELTKTHTYSIEAWKTGDMNAKAQAAEEVYNEGYNTDEQEWTKVKTAYDFNRAMAEEYLGDVFEQLDKDPIATLQSMQESFPDEDMQIARDYVEAKARFEGVSDNVKDSVEQESQESDKVIQERINKTDGMVYSTTLHGGERVFITGGTVVLDNEGYIDVANSGDLWALYPDGTKKQLREGDLREKVEVFNTDELKATERAMIEELWRDKLNTFTYNDNQGEHVITVKQTNGEISRAVVDGVEQDVPTWFINELKDKIVQKSPAADNTAEVATETPAAGNTQTMIEPIPTETRGKVKRTAYHVVPIERTLEDLESNELTEGEKIQFAQANIDEINSELQKVLKQEPKMGADIQAYKAAKAQWTVARDEWQKRLDYYNELLNRLKQPVQTSTATEVVPAVEDVAPQATNKMQPVRKVVSKKKAAPEMPETVEEFVASVMPKITPESFKRETGLSNGEQRQLVGYIAGKGKGGITIEQAAESIVANYNDELLGLGFTGDEQDVRDMIINILSNGNPKGYIKRSRALREAELSQQEREMADVWAEGMGFDSYESYLDYTESLLEDIEEQRKEFDETEYYNNLAGNYEYDTTRERKDFGRGGELLQGEQFVTTTPSEVIGEGYEGTAVPGDVRGGGDNALTQAETRQVNAVNDESVAEGGNAPGQSGVVGNNNANALQNGNNELNLQKENESDNESNQNDIPVGGQVPQSVPQGEHGTQASQVSGAQETAARLRERIESAQGDSKSGLREVENRVTREFAQENGLWIEDESKLGVPFPSGDEHNNYIDAENQVVYKVNNRMHTPSILDLLDRIEQHNKYFPDSKYSLVGFTSVSKNGDVMPVFAQGFVPDARMATNEEIDSYMGTLGFNRVGDGRYSNGEVVIKDLKPRNVLADADGDIYVVDAEFEQEVSVKSEEEIQEPRSVEEILENGDKLITNYNSRGEVATVALEHDGRIVAVDSYDEGVLFEHTEYDENGVSTSVTRYDKRGNPVVSGKTAYDYAKFLQEKKVEQEKADAKKAVEDVIKPFAKEKREESKPATEKIEDVGEKIGGAKKDRFAEGMARIKAELEETDETLTDKLAKLPVSQVFNFDLEKLREGGISNEAISFIKIVKDYLPAKPRKTYKIRNWVNNTLALYKLCLEAGTNWDRVNALLNGPQFTSSSLKEQFDAYMAIGGFDSGMNIGNAKLRQLDNKSGRYDENGKFVTLEGKWYVKDAGKHGGIYDTKEEAINALKAFAGDKAGVTSSGKKKEVKFAVYQRRQDKSIFIAVKGKSDIVIQDGFKSSKEAFDYIEANNAELQERYRALLDKTNADFEDNRPREGRDYRDGKDIPAEEFRNTFGFRGVEFGNWMKQEDRRKALNECYDALMDLAAVCKVSPKALSLGGTLGMAFGARGGGKFSAHYEPGKVVINLTKTKGAGSLAHEWFHALDNYFAKMGSEGLDVYATAGEGLFPEGISSIGKRYYDRKSGQVLTEEEYNERMNSHEVRREMADAWKSLMETLKKSDYYKRSAAYAGLHNSNYWARPTELGARAFSTWVENELSKQGASNDYLANNPRFLVSEATDEQSRFMPYPFDADATWMEEAFGNLFEVMQEKVDEDENAVLYRTAENESIENVNERFNEQLDSLTEENADVVELSLGAPSLILKAAGVKDMPMKLYGNKVIKKMKKHGFKLEELKNLPVAVADPIAVFNNHSEEGNRAILTELKTADGNFLVTVDLGDGTDIDFNIVSSVFGKSDNKIANWFNKGFATYINKEKALDYLHLSAPIAEASDKQELSSATKVINDFENPIIEDENLTREGEGLLTDREVVMDSDPYSKALGRPRYTGKKMGEYVARQRMEMAKRVKALAQKLNLNIDVLESTEGLSGKRAKAKGWYEPKGKRIVVVIPNHSSVNDAVATVLHEAVAHHGLRELFGENFDTFLQNVYNNADADVREAIETLAAQRDNGNLLTATEEYLASLAENTDFEYAAKSGWWERIKDYFFKMLRGLGIEGFDGIALTDNELRYILWRSYQNLANPGMYNNVFAQAKDTALQYELKVGNYAPDALNGSMVAGEDITPEMKEGDRLFREGETATQKEKQNILKENARELRRLHNVSARYPITALRNLRHALETEQERLEHDRLFAVRDELTQNKAVPLSIEVNPQGMTLQERITESLLKLANDNRENVETRLAAIRAYSGSLDNVLKLMRAQKGYDKKTVDMFVGLVKMYLRNNAVKGMSNYDIYRLLGLINRASGGYRMRVNRAAEQIVEIITKGHVRELQETMNRMLKTGAEKVNASGVVVQGGVDIVGKRKLNSFRDAIVMSQEAFEEKMAKIQEKVAKIQEKVAKIQEKVAKNPEDAEVLAELDAMYLAQQYKEKVADSKADEEELLRQVAADSEMRGLLNRGVISRKTYNEFADGVRRNVIELRTRRIDEMQKILRALAGDISEGMLAAKEFRERELAKRMEIHDIAEADLKGVSKAAFKSQKASKAMDWFVYKNPIVRGVMAGLPTYNNLLSLFGEKTAGMTGNLKEYFLSKYTTAVQEKWKNLQKDKETLEEKTKRITGSSFEELGDLSAKIGATISFWDGEAVRERELSYGQMMYIYMVNKMTDGAMKLRSMGISEEMVNTIEGMLPKKLVEMADWIQGDFLPQMRGRFNVVHQRMFGASMDEVENYFPLVINKGSRRENVDVSSMIPTTPSTITGSIIKRRVNTAAIDINANALDVLMRHLEEMEQWAAFGEFIKDNNILLSDTDFKNRVKNMKSVRYGDGEDILEAFKECARLATGTHRAKGNELSVNLARGLNSGKIAFGFYTALKQFLSQPAVLADAGVMDVVKAVTSPFEAWEWAAENVPGFEERWKGRTAGIETFEKTDKDWGLWDNRTMKKIRNLGMTPNAWVDAAVVAVNAKAVYDSRMKFYSSIGFDKAVANKRALHDAAVSYNETQQSGLGAFVSPMQADRTFLGMLLTLFRNSQMGYQRRLINAVKGIANRVNAYDELRANTVEKYKKMGLDDKKADEAAQRDMNVSLAKDAMSVVLFGYVLNLLWALGEDAIYLLFGDDEEEKDRVMKENAVVAFSGLFEGLTLGGQAKEVMTRLYRGENVRDLGILTTPLETDWNKVFQKFQSEGWLSGAYQLVMTSTESLTGVSPQRLVDVYAAVVDLCKGDLEMSRRVMLFATRLMMVPQSQIDKVYQDWAMSEDDEELLKMAKRYVDYKMNRENPLDKDNPELRLKKLNRFDEAVMERITAGVESAQDIELVYDRVSPKYKDKLRRMWNSLTDEEAKDSATVNAELVDDFEKKMRGLVDFKVYDSLETMDDLRDDRFLKEVEAMGMPANTKKKNGGALSDEELRLLRLYKIASKTRSSVNELKRLMDKRPEDAEKAMMRVRMLRAKAMNLIEGYNE